MSTPKKGARVIIVDNEKYRWTMRSKPTYTQDCLDGKSCFVSIELFDNPGRILSIKFPWARYDSSVGVALKPITPKILEECIFKAKKAGWKPEKEGSAFNLEYICKENFPD